MKTLIDKTRALIPRDIYPHFFQHFLKLFLQFVGSSEGDFELEKKFQN